MSQKNETVPPKLPKTVVLLSSAPNKQLFANGYQFSVVISLVL